MNSLRRFAPIALALAIIQAFPQVKAGEPAQRILKLLPWTHDDVGKKPHTGKDHCVETLAKNIDWLEGQINVFGTVVAKTPDVWGEARLTSHREEFEQELKKELTSFNKNSINGTEFASDQSFLAFAFAMNRKNGQADGASAPQIVINNEKDSAATDDKGSAVVQVGKFKGPNNTVSERQASIPIELEQTEMLDQLARYINHLNEHRRINEGDDISDSPGYSMNLIRVPVSVLPGQRTKDGFGAEITITAEPYLGPELLPTAFRDLVCNDLIDQLSAPITSFLNSDPSAAQELLIVFKQQKQVEKNIVSLNEYLHSFKESIIPDLNARTYINDRLNEPNAPKLSFFTPEGVFKCPPPKITLDNIDQYNSDIAIFS
ncbi:MAG: hypothetical protein ACO1RA_17495 [Planctomycetaceae bacterium]